MFQLRPTALLVLAVGIVPSLAAQTPSPSPQPRAASISGLVSAPPTVASEAVPLANGEWLTVEKRDLVWRSAQSVSVSKVAVRGKQLDVRETAPNRFTAIFLDSDAAQPIVVKGADRLLGLASEAIKVNFSVEAICLYQDPQSLVHAFVSQRMVLQNNGCFPGLSRS